MLNASVGVQRVIVDACVDRPRPVARRRAQPASSRTQRRVRARSRTPRRAPRPLAPSHDPGDAGGIRHRDRRSGSSPSRSRRRGIRRRRRRRRRPRPAARPPAHGDGAADRVGGAVSGGLDERAHRAAIDQRSDGVDGQSSATVGRAAPSAAGDVADLAGRPTGPDRPGPFLDDGTLVKPVAVDTTVADGADLLRTYRVKSGDTLDGDRRPLRRLDDDRLVGEPPQVQGRAPRRPDPAHPAGRAASS